MKTLIVAFFFGLITLHATTAYGFQRPTSSDYIQGVTALNEGDTEQAYTCLNKELEAHPDNGYAHCYMALVCNFYGDAKLAFHAVNESLRLIPADDAEYRSFAYYTRASLWMNVQAYEEAEADLSQAIALVPTDVENYKARAGMYLANGEFDKSLADLQTALRLDSQADVYDLMMQLLEANPEPDFFNEVTALF